MNEEERFVQSTKNMTDAEIENSLRPNSLDDYIGQAKVKESLKVYIQAAKSRKEIRREAPAFLRIFLLFVIFGLQKSIFRRGAGAD